MKKEGYLLLPQLNKILIFLTLFFSPTQLSKHFWYNFSLVYGLRVDYLSPSIYFLDILVIFSLLTTNKKDLSKEIKNIVSFLLFLSLLLLTSSIPAISLIYSIRLVLYYLFISALKILPNKKTIFISLLFSFSVELFISLRQILSGTSGSLITYWLGERMFNISSPNVARMEVLGHLTLRPYGTFSHPNVLAGWLVSTLLIFKAIYPKLLKYLHPIFILFIFLTNSHLAIISLFLYFIVNYLPQKFRTFSIITLTVLLSLGLYISSPVLLRDSLSLTDRIHLLVLSLKLFKNNPLFGVGIGSSINNYPLVSTLPTLLQPDHSSPTLLLSYTGIFGIGVLISFIKKLNLNRYFGLFPLLPLILGDHYFLTSTQGIFIFLLLLKAEGLNKNTNEKQRSSSLKHGNPAVR